MAAQCSSGVRRLLTPWVAGKLRGSEVPMRSIKNGVCAAILTFAFALGCSKPAEQPATTTQPGGTPSSSAAAPGTTASSPAGTAAQPVNKPGLIQRLTGGPVTVPEGSVITV